MAHIVKEIDPCKLEEISMKVKIYFTCANEGLFMQHISM